MDVKQASVPVEPASGLAPPGFDPSRCRNCAGEEWVCENHQDMPWESSGHSDDCGAGAPCPVCNRDMACAPYVPAWQAMRSAPTDGTEILVCGGTFNDDDDWTDTDYPFSGCALVRWVDGDWEGEARHAHDAYRRHKPLWWMPTPKLPASGIETGGHDHEDGHGAEHESPTAATSGGDAQRPIPMTPSDKGLR